MIDGYDWAGGREAMLRFGPAHGPVVVAGMPLLEEANRTRAFVVTLLRVLAARGIASALPDLPGQGESVAALPPLPALQQAMAAAVASLGARTYALGIRSGALLDTRAAHRGCWHLVPITGATLLRDLDRISLGSGGVRVGNGATIAGSDLSAEFLASLEGAEPVTDARVVRLATDPRPADRHVAGTPLWRRAEPDNDPALAAVLADDIADWMATCAAS